MGRDCCYRGSIARKFVGGTQSFQVVVWRGTRVKTRSRAFMSIPATSQPLAYGAQDSIKIWQKKIEEIESSKDDRRIEGRTCKKIDSFSLVERV